MLRLMILGFLMERPHSGYELRHRIQGLYGYARPISDGSLYPAINACERDGLLLKSSGVGRTGAARITLTITTQGRDAVLRLLRDAHGVDITDLSRFLVVLAFLHVLPPQEARPVLQRRLDFLEQPKSFFYEESRPMRRAELTDPYRQGMLTIAEATSRTERAWLHRILEAHR